MTTKEKIRQYLESKNISKNKFYIITGFSSTFLDSGNTIGVDKAKIIIEKFPDISMDWLILDKGPMLRSKQVNDPLIFESPHSDIKKFMDFHMSEIQNKNAEIEKLTKERDEARRKLAELGKPSAKTGVSPSEGIPRT